jgi:hypothetical protein
MKNLKRLAYSLSVGAAVLGLAAVPALGAEIDGEVRAGYNPDVERGFIGGGVLVPVASAWDFNPNLEWMAADDANRVSVNADIHRDLNNHNDGPAVWLGAGAAMLVRDYDAPQADTDTNLGVNMFGGLGAKDGNVRPFSQAKVTLSDETDASLAVGVRF